MGWSSKLAGGPGSEATLFGLLLCQRAVAPGEPAGPTSPVVENDACFFFGGRPSRIDNSSSYSQWNLGHEFFTVSYGVSSFLLDPQSYGHFGRAFPEKNPMHEVGGWCHTMTPWWRGPSWFANRKDDLFHMLMPLLGLARACIRIPWNLTYPPWN